MGMFSKRAGRSDPTRGRAGLAGLGVGVLSGFLVLGVLVLSGEVSASWGQGWIPPVDEGTGPPGPGTGSPGDAPISSQDCMNDYLSNVERCESIWCEPASFLWFSWNDCDDANLAMCVANAQTTFGCCLDPADCGQD